MIGIVTLPLRLFFAIALNLFGWAILIGLILWSASKGRIPCPSTVPDPAGPPLQHKIAGDSCAE